MRIPYTIYNLSTNEIIRVGVSSMSSYLYKAQTGEGIVAASSNQRLQKVVNGKIVDKKPHEISTPTVNVPVKRKLPTQGEWDNLLKRIDKLENP